MNIYLIYCLEIAQLTLAMTHKFMNNKILFISFLVFFSITILASTARLEITSPKNETTFHNVEKIIIHYHIASPLKSGERILLLLDKKTATITTQNPIEIQYPERGTHQLQLKLIDAKNQPISSSKIITIYVHQHFIH